MANLMKKQKRLFIENSQITGKIVNIILLDVDNDLAVYEKKNFTIKKIQSYYKNIVSESIPIPDKYYDLFSKINLIHFCSLTKKEFLEACSLDEWCL